MTYRPLIFTSLLVLSLSFNGCSVLSGLSERKKAEGLSRNPEQMRIASDGVVFQPIVKVEVPQFSGLQTPLVGTNRFRSRSLESAITLPRFTAVKVLSNNGRYALVEVKDGRRGFVPSGAVATESAILATAKPATPVRPLYSNTMPIDPTTGLPYDPNALYLPRMDASDAPVDEAMLNNIDSIPLPESEKSTALSPEGQEVDGIILRNPSQPVQPVQPEPIPTAPPE